MRKLMVLLTLFAPAPAWAENGVRMPDFNSDETCHSAFAPKGTRPNSALLKICVQSEQKNYNLARTAWDYLSSDAAQFCDAQHKAAMERARAIRKYNYPGLVDPYTELWLCVNKRMKAEEAKAPLKPFQKW
jgi:hypothetical protein